MSQAGLGEITQQRKTKWSLILFFGWLLSFPLQGPVLYSLAADWTVDGNYLGLVFIFFHALGLLHIGGIFGTKLLTTRHSVKQGVFSIMQAKRGGDVE
ncbi:MAG TPA: hypothetical protein DD789_04650 [Firmicutes bacterium]|jgi:hypothetical protein|nr:hypothetical protein [Bacillota bacterium]